jgi:hypothetical protein
MDAPLRSKDFGNLPSWIQNMFQMLLKFKCSSEFCREFAREVGRFINARMFNTFLDRADIISAGYGVQLKMNFSKLEMAVSKVKKELGVAFA